MICSSSSTPVDTIDRIPKMIGQFSRFVNSGPGLEKTLRLIQAVAQIAAVFTVGSTAVRLTTTKLQLALSKYRDLRGSKKRERK